VNQEDSEQNEVDGMKKAADSTGKVMQWKRYLSREPGKAEYRRNTVAKKLYEMK